MTTHIFIVNENSFPVHLKYLFAGTGAGEKDTHLSLLADISRVRPGDPVIFYLERVGFFGTFKITGRPFKDDRGPTYLEEYLQKKLIYRVMLEPLEVMPRCVSEWDALDKLPLYAKDVIWSLIYRKLKGNRGCTPITLHEAERLLTMLRDSNHDQTIKLGHGESYTYNHKEMRIETCSEVQHYQGPVSDTEDIFSEMIQLDKKERAFEENLEVYFTINVGRKQALAPIVGNEEEIIWLGNQVFCGVGMQKIDIFTITSDTRRNKQFNLVELKCVSADPDIVRQLERYVLWTNSYIHDAINSNIQPVIVTRKVKRALSKIGKPLKVQVMRESTKNTLREFNNLCISKPVKWFEFDFVNGSIVFEEVDYLS